MALSERIRVDLRDPAAPEAEDDYRLELEPGTVACAEALLRAYPAPPAGSAAWWANAGAVQVLETRSEDKDEFAVFRGTAEARLRNRGELLSATLIGTASRPDGSACTPTFSLLEGSLIASEACYAAVAVRVRTSWRKLRWSKPAGEAVGDTPLILVAYLRPAKRPVVIELAIDADDCTGDAMTEAFRVYSQYIVNADGPHEMPAGYPTNLTGTDGTVFVEADCYTFLRTHAVGYLSGSTVSVQKYSQIMYPPYPKAPPNGYWLHRGRNDDADTQARIDSLDWTAILAALDAAYPGIRDDGGVF